MKSIIVADDSNIVLTLVKKALGDNYNVISVSNGEEAINAIKNSSDVVVGMLLDLNMPKVDGFQVLEYLKENNLFKRIPTSVITGDDDADVIEKAFQYNIIDVLKKPFTIDNVKNIVDKTISISSMNF